MLENLPEQLGHALQGQRAGIENVVFYRLLVERQVARIELSSFAFENMSPLPTRYTADGEGISPPLVWHGVPDCAAQAVLIVEDADSPTPKPLVHAIAVNLSRLQSSLPEGALAAQELTSADEPVVGLNSFLKRGWLPPDPPPGHGPHRYAFQLFALREGRKFSSTPGRQEFFDAVIDRAIAGGCLIGTYERPTRQEIGNSETEQANLAELVAPVPA
jgi:Raf kinase inhibitor-like YbhB/YbcL family protein